MLRAQVNTASEDNSVWKGLNENVFRSTIAKLGDSSKNLPSDPRVYSLATWELQHSTSDNGEWSLSLQDEQRLADDLAFIAASKDGGKAVSAVALEEQVNPPGLKVRLAVNRPIADEVPKQLNTLFTFLRARAERGVHYETNANTEVTLTIV